MSVLINDLLAFSRVGRTATAAWSQLDCEEVLTQAVRNLDEVITQTGARITHDPLPTVVGEAALSPRCSKICSATRSSSAANNHHRFTSVSSSMTTSGHSE